MRFPPRLRREAAAQRKIRLRQRPITSDEARAQYERVQRESADNYMAQQGFRRMTLQEEHKYGLYFCCADRRAAIYRAMTRAIRGLFRFDDD